ncbi:hypothetical protein HMN09_00014600 [Mycena chlorophos]|uniref:Sacsin/Nov domain-containing protein n=1 Tax=Mycena chlorophos TaxID=658473 RepID=A0A8H6WM15_MYCCL|nr:hypothetical protein HMN09_00014600 [Mycena chlorophos]
MHSKIGKFGIGVRACYHVTDNPHFLSNDTLVIFDPHERFSDGRVGGVKITLGAEEREAYADQLAAFSGSLLPSADGLYPGTVVRLPLRTQEQALRSTIKDEPYEASRILSLFEDFVEKELSEVMLFLKHVRSITLKTIHPDGREEVYGTALIKGMDAVTIERRQFSRTTGARQESFRCTVEVNVGGKVTTQTWRVLHRVSSTDETAKVIQDRVGYDASAKLAHDKLFSHVALALPVDPIPEDTFNGRLFTLLPLPIHTGFPLHMHAILALTQDRQSLRNIEETGADKQSRERLLVSWNRAIFDKFLPDAWRVLLSILVENNELPDIWFAWPSNRSDKTKYWSDIVAWLLTRVVELDLAVFPKYNDAGHHVSLSEALIASTQSPELLEVLAKVGVVIVKPPAHIYRLLASRLDMQNRLLHPSRLRGPLQSHIADIVAATETDKDIILRYLVTSPGTLNNALDLPLLPSLHGPRVALTRSGQFCLVDAVETDVFGDSDCNGHLIPLDRLERDVAAVLNGSKMSNLKRFDFSHVQTYLARSVFGTFLRGGLDEVVGAVATAQIQWLARFWSFVEQWSAKQRNWLVGRIGDFHLLPTNRNTLRKLSKGVFRPILGQKSKETMDAWSLLGVRFLHQDIDVTTVHNFNQNSILSSSYIPTLLDHVSSSNSISQLSVPSASLIRVHVVGILRQTVIVWPLSQENKELSQENKDLFVQLPIFPLRIPVSGPHTFSRSTEGPAAGRLIFLRVDDGYPIPVLPGGTSFFDLKGPGNVLATLIDATATKIAINDVGVLTLAIDHLVAQPEALQEALVDRIVARLSDLPSTSVQKLAQTPFIPVVGDSCKRAPSEVVDPNGPLAPLYAGEPGKLPAGKWASGLNLWLLMAHVPFQRSLTAEIVQERVAYLGRSWGESQRSEIFEKAKVFLRLLNESWPDIWRVVPGRCLTTTAWIPICEAEPLAKASDCRREDANQPVRLFDLVLRPVQERIALNPGLRKVLGWNSLSADVLRQQLTRALTYDIQHRHLRLEALIVELSHRNLSDGDIAALREIVGDDAWIPVEPAGTVLTADLALMRSSDVLPGRRFKAIPARFLENPVSDFLTRMGCRSDPLLSTLLRELALLVEVRDSRIRTSEAVRLLEEISKHSDQFSSEIRAQILVPDRDAHLYPMSEIFFVDSGSTEFFPETGQPANKRISEDLARQLGIPFLSSLGLVDDEDDELQMGEDFTERVKGVLKEYDINYALNEFLANAVDAKATEFALVLDERAWESRRVISPHLGPLQQRPSLFLYNDAVFTKEDLDGLRRIGTGGKRLLPDTIGQYGLGALGLFYFTDVVQIVSAEYFLVLDPSGTHLPPLRRGGRRTSLLQRTSHIARQYPDQLAPFESLFEFSASSPSYPKTIFRLPLRTSPKTEDERRRLLSPAVSLSDCRNLLSGQYRSLAKDAMFFTPLKQITATHRSPSEIQLLWAVSAARSPEDLRDDYQILDLTTTALNRPKSQQRWLVSSSKTPIAQVPPEHHAVLEKRQSSTDGLVTCLALRLDAAVLTDTTAATPTHYLFSSLRLPVLTSLPVHVSAPFKISADRRHIRLDPADHRGQRLPHAAFNMWLLQSVIPSLYIATLALAAEFVPTGKHGGDPFAAWPSKGTHDDEISRFVTEAFYALAVKSAEPICRTVAGTYIAPVDAVIPQLFTPYEVRVLLCRVRPADYVEPPSRVATALTHALVAESTERQIRRVGADYVRAVLIPWSAQLVAGFEAKQIKAREIEQVLRFLLSSKVSIADLPLLLLCDGNLATPGSARYICNDSPPTIFASSHFLCAFEDPQLGDLLRATPSANVSLFDTNAVVSLIRAIVPPAQRTTHSPQIATWIVGLWSVVASLPGPPSLDDLASFPLVPTTAGDHVSLAYCRRSEVLRRPVDHRRLANVISAMERMGFTFCILPEAARQAECGYFSVTTFLSALPTPASPFAGLTEDQISHVSGWVQDHIFEVLQQDHRLILRKLPIWTARRGGVDVLCSANDLQWLPTGCSADAFDEFAVGGIPIAPDVQSLSYVMNWEPARQPLDSETIKRYLDLSTPLSGLHGHRSIASYLRMLREYLKLAGNDMIPVPDGDMRMRDVHDLYDSTVTLLREALHSVATTVFPHQALQAFALHLRYRGLQYDVDWAAFLRCAQTVSEDLTRRGLSERDVEARATLVYEFFSDVLPSIVMDKSHLWNQLDGLRFIPRSPDRSPTSTTFDATEFCRPIPMIASPADLVLSAYLPIAWSQRGTFRVPPSNQLTLLNKTLGVPSVADVVNHLAVLALQGADAYRQNRSLLHQLRATYKYLNSSRKSEVELHLSARKNERLFLNVDNPDEDDWAGQWKSAAEMQFDIPYDYGTLVGVRRFLQEYRPLLLAAGVGQHHRAQYAPSAAAAASSSDALRHAFNAMRLAGELTDLKFEPVRQETEDDSEDSSLLRAHRSFVAAAIPHVRASVGWREGSADEDTYSFPGTYFGACAVLEFIYTGRIAAKPAQIDEGHADFLRDMLELLASAHEWGMNDLKDEVGRVIDEWGLLSRVTYWMIERQAKEYEAEALLEYCHDFREKNPSAVDSDV